MIYRTFFSLFTWSICLSLIIALFFRHLRANGSTDESSFLCFTKRTRPKVPVPNVDRIFKSFKKYKFFFFLSFLSLISSSVSLSCTTVNKLVKQDYLTFRIINSVLLLLLVLGLLCRLCHDLSLELSFLLLEGKLLCRREGLSVFVVLTTIIFLG